MQVTGCESAIDSDGDAAAIALRSYQPVSSSVEEAALYKKKRVWQCLQEMSKLVPGCELATVAVTEQPRLLVLLAVPAQESLVGERQESQVTALAAPGEEQLPAEVQRVMASLESWLALYHCRLVYERRPAACALFLPRSAEI